VSTRAETARAGQIRDKFVKAREAIRMARYHLDDASDLMVEDGQPGYEIRPVTELSTAIDVLTRYNLLTLERAWDSYYAARSKDVT
jgi:predicted subunit of tRNA(5-methylaminomethyl-2-thiouridylate) methyltransferase